MIADLFIDCGSVNAASIACPSMVGNPWKKTIHVTHCVRVLCRASRRAASRASARFAFLATCMTRVYGLSCTMRRSSCKSMAYMCSVAFQMGSNGGGGEMKKNNRATAITFRVNAEEDRALRHATALTGAESVSDFLRDFIFSRIGKNGEVSEDVSNSLIRIEERLMLIQKNNLINAGGGLNKGGGCCESIRYAMVGLIESFYLPAANVDRRQAILNILKNLQDL